MATSPLLSINNIVILVLENRSFGHMLGFLYAANGNVSPTGAPFEGLTGKSHHPDFVQCQALLQATPYKYGGRSHSQGESVGRFHLG